jgi:hypothetical protein
MKFFTVKNIDHCLAGFVNRVALRLCGASGAKGVTTVEFVLCKGNHYTMHDKINFLIYINKCGKIMLKGIVSKLTKKFWMCQKCGEMKDYNKKMTASAVE